MRVRLLILLLLTGFFSCQQKGENTDYDEKEKEVSRIIDSLYVELGNRCNSLTNWENELEYKHLYELQEYLENKGKRLTIKDIYDFEIHKKDTIYIFSLKLDDFSNDVYLELEIPYEILKKYENQDRKKFNIQELISIQIDSVIPLTYEFRSDIDDYFSKIVIDRYKSLICTGKIIDMEFYKEEKSDAEKVLFGYE